ncbi:hypothetical protein [Ktedonobacter sp. SOSP1-52]|uniref:hypothetical protein n=1 Tax=Ktedonobacter sp. SOSP1-52 TaxID=2778366 RepID=UPI001915B6F5|nr:hypothetical protein [Ktedonobacter sp. SOSP1-52]
MDKPISTTHALKQDATRHLFQEGDSPPGEGATLREQQSEHIMLEIGSSAVGQPEEQSEAKPDEQSGERVEDQPDD